MGRYILQARGTIRDMRKVRPELVTQPVVIVVAPPAPEPVVVVAPELEPVAAPSYFRMTKAALIEAAIVRGIDATGTRPELLGRLSRG